MEVVFTIIALEIFLKLHNSEHIRIFKFRDQINIETPKQSPPILNKVRTNYR